MVKTRSMTDSNGAGYPGYAPPPGPGGPPLGYGPPPGTVPPPGASPYAGSPPQPVLGYGPPPGFSPYGMPSPAPFQQQPPPGFGMSPPSPFVPQMSPMGISGPTRHPGLGAPGQPANLPVPNAHPSPSPAPIIPRSAPTGELYSLFVSSIADGLDDVWLERLLNVPGPLVTLRRIKDPNGKPKAFGYAEYGDPETVLRCLEVLNGAQVPVNAGRNGTKPLKISVDEKTKGRLDAYESTRIKTDVGPA